VALVTTFIVAMLNLPSAIKFTTFCVSALGLFVILFFGKSAEKLNEESDADFEDNVAHDELREKLQLLDEASEFFTASLKPDDMFRLAASRTSEIVDFKTAVLYVLEEERLRSKYWFGPNGRELCGVDIPVEKGMSGKAVSSRRIITESDLRMEARFYKNNALDGFKGAAAIPLANSCDIFAVMMLFRAECDFDVSEVEVMEEVAERVSPMLASAFSFEQSIVNSMTDSLTNLPNERAFYLVVENRIAEAHRFPDQRPLAVMMIDVKGFADFNRLYGHTTGDNLLAFTAAMIQDQLRKMDMLCRSMNDEFWVILSTADDDIVQKIISRISHRVTETPFITPNDTEYFIGLNFGFAVLMRDGETVNELLQVAKLKKRVGKRRDESTVINFPREYLN
ncbi:MAG: sensor domain-containing diguanylate cyclase, partial [Pyrinomonadaceae bacterium]